MYRIELNCIKNRKSDSIRFSAYNSIQFELKNPFENKIEFDLTAMEPSFSRFPGVNTRYNVMSHELRLHATCVLFGPNFCKLAKKPVLQNAWRFKSHPRVFVSFGILVLRDFATARFLTS